MTTGENIWWGLRLLQWKQMSPGQQTERSAAADRKGSFAVGDGITTSHRKTVSERLATLPEITQQISNRGRIRTLVFWTRKP